MSVENILVLNGPNLDMLGTREPDVYGRDTLNDLQAEVTRYGESLGVSVTCMQSNSEGELIDIIHQAGSAFDGIVYNPGAHTHYSYALRDAVGGIDVPVVEVHLSDVSTREAFRNISVISPVCVARVKGLGFAGYLRAIDVLCDGVPRRRLGQESERVSAQDVLMGDPVCSSKDAADAADAQEGEDYGEDVAALSRERLEAVRAGFEQGGFRFLLVRDTSNVRWLTALDGVFDEERAHALLVTEEDALLHTDSRYSNAVRTKVHLTGSELRVNDGRVPHCEFARDAIGQDDQDDPRSSKLGFEDTITYSEYKAMEKAFTADNLVATSNFVLRLRSVKDASEIARLKAAQAITDAAFSHIVGFMRPGMTEREVQLELEDYMLRHGAEGLAFRSIVATGANGADPHAVPGDARLEAGQCVVMDFGAKARGYCSDMTRTVFLGQPDDRLATAWRALRHANEAVEYLLKPGITGSSAHELAERVLSEAGFEGRMGHGLGHGVGLDVHELPVLNPRNDKPLVEGNVVTVEPGIYFPGEFGMRLEDFGVITCDGFEVFTQSTHEMVII